MFFGAQSFSAAPFSSEFAGNVTVLANGNQLNISIGNTTINIVTTVPVTGNKFNLATNTVDVINWNQIIPGATGIWIPIDPDNP
jgi:hypothetical protein